MSSRRIRAAAVQLDYQPAYLGRSFSYLREPAVFQETENGLGSLVGFQEISVERARIRRIWIDHMRAKLEAILYFCAVREADLVVFPEYSIPLELLPVCLDSSNKRNMVIVAGSHTVAADEESKGLYEKIGLAHLNLRPADPDSDIRKSICPVFIPNAAPAVIQKSSRSVWETDMTEGRAATTLHVKIRGTDYKVAVLLCIDALELGHLSPIYSAGQTPDLFIAPSLSPSTHPFENVAQLCLINEIPSIYVNGAASGDSKIFARAGTAATTWPTEKDGSERLPRDAEAVVIASIDFDDQIEVRRTVRPHLGMQILSYAPLLYAAQSDISDTFIALRKRFSDPRADRIPRDTCDQLTMLSRTDPMLFPVLLQKKIRLLVDSEKTGSLRAEDIRLLLETVDIPTGTTPTFVLRQLLIQEALGKVVGLLASPESVREQERVFKVLKNITKYRAELPASLTEPSRAQMPSVGMESANEVRAEEHKAKGDIGPFLDREHELNMVRSFVNSGDQRAFVVTGMKGIGKSAMIRRIFVEVLPKWRCVSIKISEGISFEQLVAECASHLDIPVDTIPSRREATELAAAVMSRIDSFEATALFLDDCENLLGPTGDFYDEEIKRFVADLVSKPSRRNAKVFLGSSTSLPLQQIPAAAMMQRHLRGLEPRDARNLLEYWIRLQREELRGQPIEIPEKLVSFLRGHALAIRIAARLCSSYSPDQLVDDLAIFKKLREAIVEVLLERVVLTTSQKALLEFASIFRGGIQLESFRKWGGDAAVLELDSLLARFLLDFSENEYWMHPAIAQYFYEQADPAKRRSHHRIAGAQFLRFYRQSQPKDISLLVEAIHHIAASGDISQARSLGIHKEQLRALARVAYMRKDWQGSLKYYEAIDQIDPKDLDALVHMALLLGRLARWKDADCYFERACALDEACWIYQSYGAVKVNGGLYVEGEKLLFRALELNDRDSATLASLAVLKLRQSREYEAEKLFRESLDANAENAFALFNYARFLIARGRRNEATPYADLLVELEPRNAQARQLLREAKEAGGEPPAALPAAN